MKKLNKLFMGVASVAAVAAPIAAVVSCGTASKSFFYTEAGNNPTAPITGYNQVSTGEKVAFITDGGSITDKSFNEGTLNGVKQWSAEAQANTMNVYETGNHGHSTQDFATAYDKAHTQSANSTFVIAGFNHGSTGRFTDGQDASGAAYKGWWKSHQPTHRVVAIDIADNTADKFVGITFKTEQSGFLAAFNVGFQLNEQFKTEGTKDAIKVATFGGMQIPTVTAYMNGFAAGVEYFNKVKGDLRGLELIHAGSDVKSDFSDNFNAGGGTPIATTLLNKGARAIMAVAGPQTADVVEAIKTKKLQSKAFAIGVDVDQSQTYGGTVIGSAIKGLQAATETALANPTVDTDTVYTLAQNTADHQYVGYIANANYKTSVTADQIAAATTAAEATDAFARPVWA